MKRTLTYTAERDQTLDLDDLRTIIADVENIGGSIYRRPVVTLSQQRGTVGQIRILRIEA